ncbi:MAG: FimV/HubP family polar landmark protein [Pseudomonadota bacterium]
MAISLLAFSAIEAHALSLGRIVVKSALGQPLRAEVDIPAITEEEAASLSAGVAPLAAFKTAGVDYNAALTSVRVVLQNRGEGRAVLLLTSEKVINDPFIDLIIEANWSSGRVVRDYTLLFDPLPEVRKAAPVAQAPAAPAETPPAPATAPAPAPAPETRRPAPEPAARPAAPANRNGAANGATSSRFSQSQVAAARAAVATAPAASQPAPAAKPEVGGKQVQVKSGDSAARIAKVHKPATVSLDQMLVALLRQNQDAFVSNNVNRLRAGSVLTLPGTAEAEATSPQEASRSIAAQSKDFNEYRRRLAGGVPAAQVDAASRETRGKVQAQVSDAKPAAAAPDKLTLSKGGVAASGAKGSTEDKIASSRQAQDSANRVAELSKNLEELNRLKAGSAAIAPPAASAASTTSKAGIPVAAAVAPSAPAPVPAASAPAVAPVAAATASAAAASAPVVAAPASAAPAPSAAKPASAPAAAKAPVAEPGFFDSALLPILGVLALVLGGLGFLTVRQRRQAEQSSLSYPDSRVGDDSFSSQHGKHKEAVSSLGYSPSQLDAAGDVDPVEEADVYLAYGRDLQAEEILKEALQRTPNRLAVHGKLLEIYAKRRDTKAFDQLAAEAFTLTHGEGSDWTRIQALGRDLSPSNSLYQDPTAAALVSAPLVEERTGFGQGAITMPAPMAAEPSALPPSAAVDLDLDFSADDQVAGAPGNSKFGQNDTLIEERREPTLFGETLPAGPAPVKPTAAPVAPPAADPTQASAPAPGMIEFDLGSLSLEPVSEAPAMVAAASSAGSPNDPLEVKLELAVEFMAIGDTEGARTLVEEVLQQASGPVKARAQQMLADLRR